MDEPDFRTEPPRPPKLDEVGALRALLAAIRSRILGGIVVALPVAVTFWIIYWLYSTLKAVVLDPIVALIARLVEPNRFFATPLWWDRFVGPLVAIVLVLIALYFLGLFVRSRVLRSVDWLMMRVPVVTTIYSAASNVIQSLDQAQAQRFRRVVLVEFPHPGMKSLAFVTRDLRDEATGRRILCVCVLTGVMPPAGFTLFVPEESVVDVAWTVNQTLQAILSGGISTPVTIRYQPIAPAPPAADPLTDARRHASDTQVGPQVPAEGG